MIRTDKRSFRCIAVILVAAIANLSYPSAAIKLLERPEPKPAPKAPAARSRVLSAREMKTQQGRAGENPYLAGQNKWDVVYQGVNLMTGNYSTSGTDLSFEGGYGIPVNVTRSYSSNNADEGPLGYGWNLSVDVRSTAGGVLKSGRSPVMSVPTSLKLRPTGDDDPRVASDPVEAVITTDSGGQEETVQRDVDGVLTTPPWDHNVIDSTYEEVTVGTQTYDVLVYNKIKTIDGSVYVYRKHGSYTSGMTARNGGVSGEPSYVLKIDSVTDRQGNTTNYHYATTGPVTFHKTNGDVSEDRLTSIDMPNGHKITFVWGNGTSSPANRVVMARDNGNARIVHYIYSSGYLTRVTSPGGKSTNYAYGAASAPSGWTGSVCSNLLTSITDPRGFATQISYSMGGADAYPYFVAVGGPMVTQVTRGVKTGAIPITLTLYWHSTLYGSSTFSSDFVETVSTSVYPVSAGTILVDSQSSGAVLGVHLTQFAYNDNGAPFPNVGWENHRYYDVFTQNQIEDLRVTKAHPSVRDLVDAGRAFPETSWNSQSIDVQTTYNFMGKPLVQELREGVTSTSNVLTYGSPKTTVYAYWGADKYFQQKAVVDPAGRASYTDYFDASAGAGSKGQTKEVYDPKRGNFASYTPGSMPSGWYNTIAPGSGAVPSALFYDPSTSASGYDSKGRPTDVWKIAPNGSSYVHTSTTYGADNDGSWGQASDVYEDAGSTGHANRHTMTNHYTTWGKADIVTDADSRQFTTVYDLDGVVQSVSRTDVSPSVPLATYTYGTSGITNGMVTSVTDGLSGVVQSITYQSAGTSGSPNRGVGMVKQVDQSGGVADAYSVTYAYNDAGDRSQATYTTPDGTSTWRYTDYAQVGDPTSPTRAFRTLVKLSSGSPTEEEIHYAYDGGGRLTHAMFAQSKRTGFTPTSGNPYYDSTHLAQSRARASYDYDPAGRVLCVSHWWDTLDSGGATYTSSPIFKNECAYDSVKGLKTDNAFYTPVSGSWSLHHNEQYGYDSKLDYLTDADYNDGLASEVQSWTYDAAGNRSNSGYSYNNLNMMTASPTATYVNDPLGFRTSETSGGTTTTYTWDVLQRMTGRTASDTATYEYRADGMRTYKSVGTSVAGYTNTLTRHDAQMPFELETLKPDGTVTATREALGARGVDAEESVTGTWTGTTRTLGSPTIAYPIYDAHGNRVCTLSRYGSGSWSTTSPRFVDAWGTMRTGSATGGSPMRYCASLGHLQDDESGLVYMRARYYEPGSGRFMSEDPDHKGANWYTYSKNNPVSYVDANGKDPYIPFALFASLLGDYFRIMAMITSALALSKVDALRQLSEANIEIETEFYSNVVKIRLKIELDADESAARGDLRGAELASDMAAGVGIAGKALAFSLKSQLQAARILVMLEGQDEFGS